MNMTSTPSDAAPARVAMLVATAGGIGYIQPAPGTWASIAAGLVLVPLVVWLPGPWGAVVAVMLTLVAACAGWWSCPHAVRIMGRDDPSQVVIDEVAGCWLALAVVAWFWPDDGWWWQALMALAAFRLFDIIKPWPIRACERLPGATGIMVDDLCAGLAAGGLTAVVIS